MLPDVTVLSPDQSPVGTVLTWANVTGDSNNDATRTRLIENLFLPIHIRFSSYAGIATLSFAAFDVTRSFDAQRIGVHPRTLIIAPAAAGCNAVRLRY